MFGHIQINKSDLSEEALARYRAAYCGLCRALQMRHGQLSRLGLTYDLTFLSLLLSSLYEPEEWRCESRCMVHPMKKHPFAISQCTEYAADMTVALCYHKCLDDWQDERSLPKKGYAALLNKQYRRVREEHPRQCAAIEEGLKELSDIEAQNAPSPDAGANCFGRVLAAIFIWQEDRWAEHLARMGYGLGRYIYLADAAVDLREDTKKGRYNPLQSLSMEPDTLREALKTILGEVSIAFEKLPLVQDERILRSILYSGIWQKYNEAMQAGGKKA